MLLGCVVPVVGRVATRSVVANLTCGTGIYRFVAWRVPSRLRGACDSTDSLNWNRWPRDMAGGGGEKRRSEAESNLLRSESEHTTRERGTVVQARVVSEVRAIELRCVVRSSLRAVPALTC